jgi:CMP-2-keto-3-deoxyoctulosonic acid synthetase
VGSKLVIVSTNARIEEQLQVTGITSVIGTANIYSGDDRVGASVTRAQDDAHAWIEARQRGHGSDDR